MIDSEPVRLAIESGNADRLRILVTTNVEAANTPVVWGDGNNVTDPLHYVSDCYFNHTITDRQAQSMATVLLAAGARVDGDPAREAPLLGATSLGAGIVADILIEAGADISQTSIFGANALHWAAYMGLRGTIQKLLAVGAPVDQRCTEFQATALFWAAQGFSRHGPDPKREQVGAAHVLLDHGADPQTKNVEGVSVLERAGDAESIEMVALISRYLR
ncbi:MAG: ankyrin repeat domain-containing protein [Pseudomonadota bacterium]